MDLTWWQILDLPGIIEGAKDGKGRGRQVIAGKFRFLECMNRLWCYMDSCTYLFTYFHCAWCSQAHDR